ncbi:MAG TPA: hypothetical protein VL918_02100 [Sphingobium sp.]|nr:hypothetical protein [Sphingobium sp.]
MTRRITTTALLGLSLLLLQGCIAKTALDVATMPVKATAQAADWATTSQDEADRNHGRDLRKRCARHYDPEYCDRD